MTWKAHQARGFFGFSPPGSGQNAWQAMRWCGTRKDPDFAVVDIGEALAESEDVRTAFWKWMQWPDSPPFSGGVLTDWPARMIDGLAFARQEWAVVQAYLKSLEVK